MHVVIMGVCGCGKTTLARSLHDSLHYPYAEGDDFHPEANRRKMASGIPLTDEDRWPWLDTIRAWMDSHATGNSIITCSALKHSYRDVLRQVAGRVVFVHLTGPKEVLAKRLAARTGHFMPVSLLDSQLETLEPLQSDEDGFEVDIRESIPALTQVIIDRLGLQPEESNEETH